MVKWLPLLLLATLPSCVLFDDLGADYPYEPGGANNFNNSQDLGLDAPPSGPCSLLEPESSCPGDEVCGLDFDAGVMGLVVSCLGPASVGPVPADEVCDFSGDKCQAGSTCAAWNSVDPSSALSTPRCYRYCELASNQGCSFGEQCVQRYSTVQGWGICLPTCNPLETACAPDICSIDGFFPDTSSQPTFSCRENSADASTKVAGDACDPFDTRNSGCPLEAQVCYEVDQADFQCVRPCTSDAQCAPAICRAQPAGSWDLRWCEP